jgi:two-component system chemotaxis response regulator CheB/chemosensory pili system protein ChpB (putative protein-glutamate methylesterase)
MSTDIRVALVYEQDAGTQALRTALANAGVTVALECRASALDSSAILATDVDAIVVNLDAELEELLDVVTEALDAATQPVIYNDPAASSDLSGWDRARWMRHLSAKLKGQSNFTPPPPPGAQAIPMPAPKLVEAPAALTPSAPVDTNAAVASTLSAGPDGVAAGASDAAAAEATLDIGFGDLDLMFDTPASSEAGAPAASPEAQAPASVAAPAPAPADTLFELGLADLDLMFEAPASPADNHEDAHRELDATPAEAATSVEVGSGGEFDMADLEAMFDEPADATPAPVTAQHHALIVGEDIGDLDALFDDAPANDADEPAPVAVNAAAGVDTVELELDSLFSEVGGVDAEKLPETVATQAELTDLDELFREFEASQKAAAPAPPETAAAAGLVQPAVDPPKPAKSVSAPMEWSLEPVEEDIPKGPQGDRLVTEWRLDAPSKPLSQQPPKPEPAPATAKVTSGPAIPADLDASLALADLRLLDDAEPLAATPVSAAPDLGAFDLSSLDLESMEPNATTPVAADLGHDLSLADFDFDFIPEQVNQSAGIDDDAGLHAEGHLGDLDSLFEPALDAPVFGLSLPDLDRVFVLGASIGGPEAIKTFLAHLPASVAAAFIVAQHMGSEFLEMMALQLDAASPLPVRCPKAGERLRHGEVIVAPANEQLVIDDGGHVQLSAASSGSPYNPSIDQLVRAAADRFGDHATLILFSGMGSDAVEGGRYLTSKGGQVWAQDRGSCVIASMIDSAKSQGLIRFEGTPAQLAERVLQVLS